MQNIQINWVNPKTLVPNEVAGQTFSLLPPNFESIRDSIATSGILEPLIVKGNMVISGNLRLKIALELGMEKIPVMDVLNHIVNIRHTTFHHAQQSRYVSTSKIKAMNDTTFITIEQVAELVHSNKSSIYKMTSSNSIPFYKFGKKLLFDKNEVIEFVKSGKIIRKRFDDLDDLDCSQLLAA